MAEAEFLFENDLKRTQRELCRCDWYTMQPPGVRAALQNMCFNLGLPRLLSFKKMIAALEKKDYLLASIEALNSKWAKQVGQRSKDIALVISEGK